MATVVSFNGVEIPQFVKVTGISFPALADISVRETEIPRGYGNLDNGVKFGGKAFKLSTVLVIPEGSDIHGMADDLKGWLRGNDWKPSALTFGEQSDKYVLARVSNAVDIEDLFLYGETDIEFYAANPTKYAVAQTVVNSVSGSATVPYTGLETAPTDISITIAADCTNLTLTHTPSYLTLILLGNFKLGQVVSINSVSKVVKVGSAVSMGLLDFRSRWIKLSSGSNVIKLTTATAGVVNNFKVTYRKAD